MTFDEAYARHRLAILNYAIHCAGIERAEDVAQIAWFKASRRFGQFRGESAFKSWVCAIVKNTTLDLGRRQRSKKRYSDFSVCLDDLAHPLLDLSRNPEQAYLKAETDALVMAALILVPREQRLAVAATLHGDCAKAARRFGLHTGTLKTRAHRGRKAFALALARLQRVQPGLQTDVTN